MVICGSYMFELSDKDMKKKGYNKGDGNREGSNTFMSNTSYQCIENQCRVGEGGNNTKYHILCRSQVSWDC